MPFYAVARGRTVGTFLTWNECKSQVDHFPNARYKKFNDKATAEAFINEHRVKPAVTGTGNPKEGTVPTDVLGLAISSRPKPMSLKPSSSYFGSKSTDVSSCSTGSGAGALAKKQVFKPRSAQLIPARSMAMASSSVNPNVNPKRKFQVTEDRVVPIKKAKLDQLDFNTNVDLSAYTVDEDGYVVVYTDGACKGNGRKQAKAGIGVWFGDYHPMNISLPVEGNRRTNNTAEIQAAEKAILKAKGAGINKLNIRTDSQFLINCITKWIDSWRRNNWMLKDGQPVKNREDLEKLSAATENVQIKWAYVKGHSGHHGNDMADQLAVAGSLMSLPVKR